MIQKHLSILLFFFIVLFQIQAQTSEKLSGAIIGTTAFSNDQTLEKAFDNNSQTWFKSQQASGGWVGVDLGEKHVITKIEFQTNDVSHNTLGLFEGANNPDFGDALPLYIIKERLTSTNMQTADIVCSRGFRYVRYIGPSEKHSRIAELVFYGYISEGDNSQLTQLTNLPTISIHTTNAEDVVVKDKYLAGIVSVISENGTTIYTDSLEIKGRGNASWGFPKKPYRMKLYNKVNLLGLPAKEKNWTLINNYGDKTLMRNLLAFDLSKRLEMIYTPAGIAVDVLLNGEYKGTYQLCDQIEVATGRVEIEKMKKSDISEPNLTGGYLIEVDAYANQELSWFQSALKYIPVTIKYPKDDDIVPQQSAYIKSHFDKMEAAVYARNYTDPENGYRKYLHMPTFIRHFLIGEISGNTDTYWSTYMFKKREDDLLYVGPVWDFDIAYENDNRTYPINSNSNWIYTRGSAANGMREFINRIFTDASFNKELKETYSYYRNSGILSEESLIEVINNYEQELIESQKLNFTRWNILGVKVHQNYQALNDYRAEVNTIRKYIKERLDWMDKKLNYVPASVDNTTVSTIHYWSENNKLYIEGFSKDSLINIYDIYGRTFTQHLPTEQFSIELPKGVYIVSINDNMEEKSTIKVMM